MSSVIAIGQPLTVATHMLIAQAVCSVSLFLLRLLVVCPAGVSAALTPLPFRIDLLSPGFTSRATYPLFCAIQS